jgi:hypothetical protein
LNVVGGCASSRYLTSIPTNEHIGNAASKMKAIYLAILPTSIKLKHIDCLNGNAIIDFEFFFWLDVIVKPLF